MTDCRCISHGGFLTKRGYRLVAQQNSLEGLAPRGVHAYVDRVGSVSALAEAEEFHVFDDALIEQQYRRFLNGS